MHNEATTTWPWRTVDSLFEVITGTTPSTKNSKYWTNGDVIWFTPSDLSKLKWGLNLIKSDKTVTEQGVREAGLRMIPTGSILLSTRAPVGYVGVVRQKCAFNQGCKALVPIDARTVIPEFYAYYLLGIRSILEARSGGSTFKELSKDGLARLEVPYPSLREQNKIVEILSSVDDTLRCAQKIADGTEKLKSGVLSDLISGRVRHPDFVKEG